MIALIRWIIGLAITVLFVCFAAFNRQTVELYYSPLHDSINIPLYAAVLGFSALAFLLGGLTVWLNDGKLRRERRGLRKHVKTLEKELVITETKVATDPDNIFFPSHKTKNALVEHDK